MNSITEKTQNDIVREIRTSMSLIDDIMFRQMAKDLPCIQEVLRTILNDPDLTVIETTPQVNLTSFLKRSVVVDCLCTSKEGKIFNVEVQRDSGGIDHEKRVRYHASAITVDNTKPGTEFADIPDVTVIYICGFDIFGDGLSVYTVERTIAQTGKKLYNGLDEVYVTPVEDGTDISELMKMFTEQDSYSPKFPETSRVKEYYRSHPEGEKELNDIVETYFKQQFDEGRAEGRKENRAEYIDNACRLVHEGSVTRDKAVELLALIGIVSDVDEFDERMKVYSENANA
ncbi:MAG: PD-(D/E)XK nuclease family transposase [Eubacteriaceae bacterium]|nr:PD-(D/E)XK nuclease family transposase [Eubacteriaceae bacterium]